MKQQKYQGKFFITSDFLGRPIRGRSSEKTAESGIFYAAISFGGAWESCSIPPTFPEQLGANERGIKALNRSADLPGAERSQPGKIGKKSFNVMIIMDGASSVFRSGCVMRRANHEAKANG
ncbi:uncharacterized protein LOC100712513 isoform X6 [Anopheles sinensis]|uniref:Uncharacterized protein LOC100712513 isoform X6 n=1 Tax=Anopheles sinensis TaxID=74873 RepID=A0A084W461_ANOSI|nr:uncharacterized protein LOC100712513 isoform X6 [Anopheles sinensis]